MGKKYGVFLSVTALISIASVVIICISMGTTGWVYATAASVSGLTYGDSDVNHGLFTGSLTRQLVQTATNYDLYITCVWGSNACAWSCLSTASERTAEVESLLAGETPSFACSVSTRALTSTGSTISRADNGTSTSDFLNAGAWLSNVIFMTLLLAAAAISAGLSVVNSVWSPSESYLNVLGIYIANAVTVGLDVIVLIIWGVHYGVRTQTNVAIRDTIVGEFTSETSLGYSYWLLLTPPFLHAINIGLLYLRDTLINSEPPETKIDIEDIADGTLVLF
ncbi:uncharacterized protein LOC124300655 [Neodiprion virginianus]|uniref:Uncharacterized protein LOC107223726 n=1 Tax=Neodiprion lecontei TaxID=441921 RepID=A0A6J0BX35_NEOLC|nr:uncharacterized protein LOC107223726 [Neodiprion lecontei]XP_046418630.1 uncharacterized protein LOC124178895 [Neodiprion fabricii]XP_046418631.1 uncharacterized protein LOC124178895 [Neodiprion fabricii]XP_046418632.1 uncharacterized protein LOC124178895 [Neodiprion fabricii]XP_046590346.1 uncharacterized protein LOC107223726 [Neodiprion lecontei]XP_046590347.1 uncharacterized protein LOC107223726 [Neodiprion lecontei]XP_046590349.1 uncharacterized protein LOC107223726 [Neodiprion leconte